MNAEGQFSRWLMLGGALVVLGVGLAVVVAARIGRRRELDRRMAVREEIAAILARNEGKGESSREASTAGQVSIDLREEAAPSVRRSPMSPYMPDVRPRDTFIDLPSDDPVIDLADETVDLTGQRREVRPGPENRD